LSAEAGSAVVGGFVESATPGRYIAEITSTTAGSFPVSVTVDGEALSAGSGNVTAVFVEGTPPGPVVSPSESEFSVSESADVPADGVAVQTVTVRLRDVSRAPVSQFAPRLTAEAGVAVVGGFAESATAGTYVADVTSTVAGSFPVSVTVDGEALSAGSSNVMAVFMEAIQPGPVVSLTESEFSVSESQDVLADGEEAQTVTVRLRDAGRGPVSGFASRLSAEAGAAVVGVFAESATAGRYVAEITSTTPGRFPVSVTVDGEPLSAGSANAAAVFTEVTSPGPVVSVTESEFSVSAAPGVLADGVDVQTITVRLRDAGRGAVSGFGVRLVADAGLAVVGGFVETPVLGTYVAEVTSTTAGSFPVMVTVDGEALSAGIGNALAVFVEVTSPGPVVSVTESEFSVSSSPDVAADGDGVQTVTVQLRDAGRAAVSGFASRLSAEAGNAIVGVFVESATPGRYIAEITSTIAGTFPVSVTVDGEVLSAGSANAVAVFADLTPPIPIVSIAESSFDVSATPAVPADGISVQRVNVVLRDADRNPIAGAAVQLMGVAGVAMVSAFDETGIAGTYVATVTSQAAGSFPVMVTIDGRELSGGLANTLAVFTAVRGSGVVTDLGVTPADAQTGDTVTVVVTVTDDHANPVSGAAVHVWTTPVASPALDTTGTTDAAGRFATSFTSATGGTVEVHATVNGLSVTGSPVAVTFTAPSPVREVSLAASDFEVSSRNDVFADGAAFQVVTVTLRDAELVPMTGLAVHLTATAGGAAIAAFVESTTPGVYTARVTSTAPGAFLIEVLYSGQALSVLGTGIAVALFVPASTGTEAPGHTTSTPPTSNTPPVTPSASVTPGAGGIPSSPATAPVPTIAPNASPSESVDEGPLTVDPNAEAAATGTQPKTGAGNVLALLGVFVLLAATGLALTLGPARWRRRNEAERP
jgi:adhesin/invasin